MKQGTESKEEIATTLMKHLQHGPIVRAWSYKPKNFSAQNKGSNNHWYDICLLMLHLHQAGDLRCWMVRYFGQDAGTPVGDTNFPSVWYQYFKVDESIEKRLNNDVLKSWVGDNSLWISSSPHVYAYSEEDGDSGLMPHLSIRSYAQMMAMWAVIRSDYNHARRGENMTTVSNQTKPPLNLFEPLSRRLNEVLRAEEQFIFGLSDFVSR